MNDNDCGQLRQTQEYSVAWDIEVWRNTQLSKIAQDIKERERQLLEEMKSRLAVKEKVELRQMERREQDLLAKEKKLLLDQSHHEKRKTKLIEVEREVMKQLQETEALRQRLSEESESSHRRVQEESRHAAEVYLHRATRAEADCKKMEERVAQAQSEYTKLWEEYNNFRRQKIFDAANPLSAQLEALRAQHESAIMILTERHERSVNELSTKLQSRLEAVTLENVTLREQLASTKHLEYEVARLKRELKCAHREIDTMRRETFRNRFHVAKKSEKSNTIHQDLDCDLKSRIALWTAERTSLLAQGVYSPHSSLIKELDERLLSANSVLVT